MQKYIRHKLLIRENTHECKILSRNLPAVGECKKCIRINFYGIIDNATRIRLFKMLSSKILLYNLSQKESDNYAPLFNENLFLSQQRRSHTKSGAISFSCRISQEFEMKFNQLRRMILAEKDELKYISALNRYISSKSWNECVF